MAISGVTAVILADQCKIHSFLKVFFQFMKTRSFSFTDKVKIVQTLFKNEWTLDLCKYLSGIINMYSLKGIQDKNSVAYFFITFCS